MSYKRKYVAGTMIDVAEVRAQLRTLTNSLIGMRERHSQAWRISDDGHPEKCFLCKSYNTEISGVRRAIRLFGGNPR
jgi:hypothetical protein